MATIDFAAIKSDIAIERVVEMLNLPKLTRRGEQFRAPCPQCKEGGDRALVVTPSKAGFYCFAAKRGGDCIALLAHVEGITQTDAAQRMRSHFGLGNCVDRADNRSSSSSSPEPKGRQATSPVFRAMEPLAYLDAHHESVQALDISPKTAEHFGAGFAGKGVMRGRFAVPIKALDGTLIAYVGIAVTEEQQPRLLFHNFDPTKYLFNLNQVENEDSAYVTRDPIEVLKAFENGVTNVVSFLSPITSDALQVLSIFMDERGIEYVEIL